MNWRLGLVNESQHSAHQAFEHKGATSDLLKRLGMIYLVKGNQEAAKRYFLNLKNVPFQRTTAEYFLHLNENPAELDQDFECKYIRSIMPKEDLISRAKASLPKLDLLLQRNPKNKMAFRISDRRSIVDRQIERINGPSFGFQFFWLFTNTTLCARSSDFCCVDESKFRLE